MDMRLHALHLARYTHPMAAVHEHGIAALGQSPTVRPRSIRGQVLDLSRRPMTVAPGSARSSREKAKPTATRSARPFCPAVLSGECIDVRAVKVITMAGSFSVLST